MESLLEIPYLFSLFASLFKLVTSQGNRMKVVIKFVQTLLCKLYYMKIENIL